VTVHFIGAGPGAPDLLTLRGRDLIARCPVCLYAGSLVPREVIAHAAPGARVIDTAPLNLDQIIEEMRTAFAAGLDVARVHTGDPSIYGAIGEQIRRLRALGIPYEITPGVPSFVASAAVLGIELTLPGVSQSVIVTRAPGRSSPMPEGETLEAFGRTGATLAIHLSAALVDEIVRTLSPIRGADCPVAVVFRATQPDERIVRGTLADIAEKLREAGVERTAIILVGAVVAPGAFDDSALYHPERFHYLRPGP